MPRYRKLDSELSSFEKIIRAEGRLEPIIVDGKLVAIEMGELRIAPEKGGAMLAWAKEPPEKG